MTAPDDPFRSPTPGASPSQQYGGPQSGSPQYGGPQYGGPQYGSPQYGSPQYGQQPGGPPFGQPRPAPRNGLGIAALVVGILALLTGVVFVGGLFGIAAIVLGVLGRGRVTRGEATNGGMAIAGIVLGVLGLLIAAFAVYGAVQLFNSEQVSDLADCLSSAGDDVAAQQQCQEDFAEGFGS